MKKVLSLGALLAIIVAAVIVVRVNPEFLSGNIAEPDATIKCTDTDGGQNFMKKGTVTVVKTDKNKSSYFKVEDECMEAIDQKGKVTKALIEQYCTGKKTNPITSKTVICNCVDGACKNKPKEKLEPKPEAAPLMPK
ncbi:MAG: hypothetical protein NTZ80_00030 [Patescibacteria group bacterium]|nr:hypothetical protein [Patescibacteria group bacterium]